MTPPSMLKVKLKDVCERITVGHVGSMADAYVADGIPFLRSQNILPFRLDIEDVKYVSLAFHEKLRKSALNPGDVAIVRTGYPGTACVIPNSFSELNCSDLVIITPSSLLNSYYLAAIFNSSWGKASVAGNLVGAAQQHFNVGAAKELEITLPSRLVQDRIAGILSAYDNLIANSQRRIKILEGMARNLYREWFVHYRLPAHENNSRLGSAKGGIPQGWELKKLFSLASVSYGKNLPTKKLADDGDYPVYGAAKIIGRYTEFTRERRTIICGCRGSVGEMQITQPQCFVTNNSFTFDPTHPDIFFWLFHALKERGLRDVVGGAAQPQITLEGISSVELTTPPLALLRRFQQTVAPIYEQAWLLDSQSQNLRCTRDLLLPRLLSGQINVDTA
jgi:type I restriction enzyme S subunit